jgi:hypothetical protein
MNGNFSSAEEQQSQVTGNSSLNDTNKNFQSSGGVLNAVPPKLKSFHTLLEKISPDREVTYHKVCSSHMRRHLFKQKSILYEHFI